MRSCNIGDATLTPALRWTLDPCGKHLSHGSFGAVPVAVQHEQQRLREIIDWNPVRWFACLPQRIASARIAMAEILNVPASTLAFVQNASAGASVVYQRMLDQGPAHVVVTNHGYGAVSMGAQRLASRTGGTYRVVDIPLHADADDVIALVSTAITQAPTTLLVIDQITSPTARAFPVGSLCQLARSFDVKTLVDGAHAPGVLEAPVCVEADWWVGNLHKFVCAPRGTAMLYSRESDQQLYPVIDSWGAKLPFPERFDYTGTFDTTGWLLAPFAWRHIDDTVGWPELRMRSAALADQAVSVLSGALAAYVDTPSPDVGMPVGPMRLLKLPDGLAGTREQADALRIPFIDATGIAVSFSSFDGIGYLRLSVHAYNTIDDYEYLAKIGVPLLHRWSLQACRETENPTHIKEDACARNSAH